MPEYFCYECGAPIARRGLCDFCSAKQETAKEMTEP